jgi:hypothetical protein
MNYKYRPVNACIHNGSCFAADDVLRASILMVQIVAQADLSLGTVVPSLLGPQGPQAVFS